MAILQSAPAIKRRKSVEEQTGQPRSTIYARIGRGTFPPPVKIGARAVGWLAHEVDAVMRGHVRGLDDHAMRMLVADLVAQRSAEAGAGA